MSVLGNQNIGSRLLTSDAFQLPRKPQTKPPVTRPPHVGRRANTPVAVPAQVVRRTTPPVAVPAQVARRPSTTTPVPAQVARRPSTTTPVTRRPHTTTTTNLNNNLNRKTPSPPPSSLDDIIEWSGVTELGTVEDVSRRRGRKLSIEQTLARYTGSEAMIMEGPKEQVDRHEKTIVQVLDEMSGSLNIFRHQVTTFVTSKVTEAGIGRTNELSELQTFLGSLEPDMNKFIEACTDIEQIPLSSLKKHFGSLVTLASAIQSFTVHHLRFAPNIGASDIFNWLSETQEIENRRQALSESRAHFELVKDEIRQAVNSLLAQRVFV